MSIPLATRLLTARLERKPIPQLSLTENLSVSQAYSVQEEMLGLELAQGKTLSGYKMGLTSKAKQKDVGVDEAIFGYLLSDNEVKAKLSVASRIHTRVEPEIAVRLKKDLSGGSLTILDVVDGIEWAGLAIEVLDSRYENFKFTLSDVIADNTSASGYVLGKANQMGLGDTIRLQGVILRKNGAIVETGAPAATLGHPFQSVVELAKLLGQRGRILKKGMVVLTGGITASVTVEAGDHIEVVTPAETLSLEVTG